MSDDFEALFAAPADRRSEQTILNDTLVAVSALPDTLVFRNNTGMAWQGEPVRANIGQSIRVEPGMKILRNARPVHFGLEGSGDIIGASGGVPVCIETKRSKGRQQINQQRFEQAWTRAGGLYVLARSPVDATKGICSR